MKAVPRLEAVFLYDEPDAAGLNIEEIGGFLASQFPALEVFPRTDFLTYQLARYTPEQRATLVPELERQLARAQVRSFGAPIYGTDVDEDERYAELGPVYLASLYQELLGLLLHPEENRPDQLHIVFTDRAFGSRRTDEEPFSLEILRVGAPTLISLTGLVEALPRPREYQFKRAQFAMLGADEEALEDLAEAFADRTFGYGDPRINEVCKGYALMACFERVFGETSCPDPTCRLYHARTQEEMIAAQCGPKAGLCEHHQAMLRLLRTDR